MELKKQRRIFKFTAIWLMPEGSENHSVVYHDALLRIRTKLKRLPSYLGLTIPESLNSGDVPLLIDLSAKKDNLAYFEQAYANLLVHILQGVRLKNYEAAKEAQAFSAVLALQSKQVEVREVLSRLCAPNPYQSKVDFQGIALWQAKNKDSDEKLMAALLGRETDACYHSVKKRNIILAALALGMAMLWIVWGYAYHSNLRAFADMQRVMTTECLEDQASSGISEQHWLKHFGINVSDYYAYQLQKVYGNIRGLNQAMAAKPSGDLQAQINAVMRTYNTNLAAYYPFNSKGADDVSLQNFTNFFATGGLLDHLNATLQDQGKVNLGEPLTTLMQIRAQVQSQYFAQNKLGFNLSIMPVDADNNLIQANLMINKQIFLYRHDPQVPAAVSWNFDSASHITLSVNNLKGKTYQEDFYGPWALNKFLQTCKPGASGTWSCILNDYWVSYRILDSSGNPWVTRF
jgi:hypothetical protein